MIPHKTSCYHRKRFSLWNEPHRIWSSHQLTKSVKRKESKPSSCLLNFRDGFHKVRDVFFQLPFGFWLRCQLWVNFLKLFKTCAFRALQRHTKTVFNDFYQKKREPRKTWWLEKRGFVFFPKKSRFVTVKFIPSIGFFSFCRKPLIL